MKRWLALVMVGVAVTSCATVRDEDLKSWQGQPVSALEKHPVFLTMRVVKTQASDGTQIWNYVNGQAASSCQTSGTVSAPLLSMASYSQFTTCMQTVAACNNIFYIKGGIVERYTPIGTGGARCYTDARTQPGATGPTNYR